jgi:hypothetical protein
MGPDIGNCYAEQGRPVLTGQLAKITRKTEKNLDARTPLLRPSVTFCYNLFIILSFLDPPS